MSVPTNNSIYQFRIDNNWCGNNHAYETLKGLDDRDCVKKFPRYFDRNFKNDDNHFHNLNDEFHLDFFDDPRDFSREITVYDVLDNSKKDPFDLNTYLRKDLPEETFNDFSLAAGIIHRSNEDPNDYKIHYFGLNSIKPFQPWSSTKCFAGHLAARKLRLNNNKIGLSSENVESSALLDDLMTIVTSYDETMGYTSNSIGAYYHTIGGYDNAFEFVGNVLGGFEGESFGGNYGEKPKAGLGYNFRNLNDSVQLRGDTESQVSYSNNLSALTMANYMRRLIMTREDNLKNTTSQNFEWSDVQSILYGAKNSRFFPELQWGGMSISADIYLQLALENYFSKNNSTQKSSTYESDQSNLPEEVKAIFSKLGAGYTSREGGRFEITLNGYVATDQIEMVVSVFVFGKDGIGREADENMIQLVSNAIEYAYDNFSNEEENEIFSTAESVLPTTVTAASSILISNPLYSFIFSHFILYFIRSFYS